MLLRTILQVRLGSTMGQHVSLYLLHVVICLNSNEHSNKNYSVMVQLLQILKEVIHKITSTELKTDFSKY